MSLLFLTLACLALILGYVGSQPSRAERFLAHDPKKRDGMRGLYMVYGVNALNHANLNRVAMHSLRYEQRALLDIKPLVWAIGLTSYLLTLALCLNWLFADVTGYGGWNFFDKDVPMGWRLAQTACLLLPFGIVVIGAGLRDWTGWSIAHDLGEGLDDILNALAAIALVVQMVVFGNHGLLHVVMGVVLLPRKYRALVALGLLALLVAQGLGLTQIVGPAPTTLLFGVAVAGLMAWVSWLVVTEIFATVKWYDMDGAKVLAGCALAFAVGVGLTLATPLAMAAFLDILFSLAPEGTLVPAVDVLDPLRSAGWPYALALTVSAPLFPTLWLIGLGLGDAIARATPMMRDFLRSLKGSQGPLGAAQIDALFAPYRAAHFVGYSASAVLTLAVYILTLRGLAPLL